MVRCFVCIAAIGFIPIAAQDLPRALSLGGRQRPEFEVASIKECKGGDNPPSISSPDRLSLGCWPLWRLIADAYETFEDGKVDAAKPLVPLPVEGAPDWVTSTRYSIDAKAESAVGGAMMRGPMMQVLLEKRFQLKVHREAREVAGYLMTVMKGGSKLQATVAGSCSQLDPTDLAQKMDPSKTPCMAARYTRKEALVVYEAHGISLSLFASSLRPNGRPVIDQTGLTGVFDIHLEWEPNVQGTPDADAAAEPAGHMSAISAMRTQLGLQLSPGKGTRQLLIIDRVERPSAN